MRSGWSAWVKTSVNAPSNRRNTVSTQAGKSPTVGPPAYARATRWTATSESVSLAELDPGVLQLGAQRGEVLDDAVVDDGDLPGGVTVRVCIAVRRPTVRGPAGVPHAGVPARTSPGRPTRPRGWPADRRHGAPSVPRPSTTAIPDESYPRYSIRRSASTTTSRAARCPT